MLTLAPGRPAGGDDEGSPGVAIYVQASELHALVSTGAEYWNASTVGQLASQQWVNIGKNRTSTLPAAQLGTVPGRYRLGHCLSSPVVLCQASPLRRNSCFACIHALLRIWPNSKALLQRCSPSCPQGVALDRCTADWQWSRPSRNAIHPNASRILHHSTATSPRRTYFTLHLAMQLFNSKSHHLFTLILTKTKC